MRWQVLNAVTATLLTSTATASYVNDHGLPVEKTVTLPDGQVVDWVRREIQGEIAQPPASLIHDKAFKKFNLGVFNETTRGPAGTVPIPRSDGRLPQNKVAPPQNVNRLRARQYADQHWYSSTSQSANSHGSSAALSMFKAYVANNNDFSLLQTAVVRLSVPNIGIQTVEAGWINYPRQTASPHLFSFFTTNAYGGDGDYVSGWNTEYRGWVQYDSEYYPGMELSPLSTVDGDQHDLQVQYLLDGGNWWLAVNGRWVGYYAGSMFVTRGNAAATTLADHADTIDWYGEIYQSEGPMTTTDMGSGHFAAEGYGKAAYIRNIRLTGTDDKASDYDGSRGVIVSDSNRYSIDTHFKSGTSWGSYFFLGGPGAGGVIGG
ncbi:carboxyl-terminal proteinase [Cordyceps fumosorosea ARSEF 2679]|uniref:Carboxyl-terminal proteinase n=1 Tax=Cordyceps fumosorosea (strain ARSEF 2679) TaxID=1081104 RepID=A0A168BPX6_CORFA|nr:carboxyl-terminal proteinase [Cordyceps fumosorosea ARSEF 2679]OAA70400.1 carboxyl-terminal proteinase [Cordyceps fumosorosea ARSEF 2679]